MSFPTDRWPTAGEILQQLRDLAADQRFKSLCAVKDFGLATSEGRTTNFLRIGKLDAGDPGRARVVFVGGHHAREWAPPTALTNFIGVLLDAFVGGKGINLNQVQLNAGDVQTILDGVDLYVAPMVNPDGYEFSHAIDAETPEDTRENRGWRKNRRLPPDPMPPGATCPGNKSNPLDKAFGVDVNRNYAVLWDFDKFYITPPQNSKDPCSEAFIGTPENASTDGFTELESKNVKELLDKTDPLFYVDVHMAGRTVLHSWGTAPPVEVPDPTPVLDQGKVRDALFKERIGTAFFAEVKRLASVMASGAGKGGATAPYVPHPGADPTAVPKLPSIAGASDDYAASRNLGTSKPQIRAFTLECGEHFLPHFDSEFPVIQSEVHGALLSLLRDVARAPAPTGSTPPPKSCNNCMCAIAPTPDPTEKDKG